MQMVDKVSVIRGIPGSGCMEPGSALRSEVA